MNFLLDMPVSPKTEAFLHQQGYEAIRVDKLNMQTAADKEIFAYALREDMVIITMDLDFGEILAYFKAARPSVIILRLTNPAPGHVNEILANVIPRIKTALESGSIVIVEEGRIRIKHLPIE